MPSDAPHGTHAEPSAHEISMMGCCGSRDQPSSQLEGIIAQHPEPHHLVLCTRGPLRGEIKPALLDAFVRKKLARQPIPGFKEASTFASDDEVYLLALFTGISDLRGTKKLLASMRDQGDERFVYVGALVWEIQGQTIKCDGPWSGGIAFVALKPGRERAFLDYIQSDAFAGKIRTSSTFRAFFHVDVIISHDTAAAVGMDGLLGDCLARSRVAIVQYLANPWLNERGTASENSEDSQASLHERSMGAAFAALFTGAHHLMARVPEFHTGQLAWSITCATSAPPPAHPG